MSASAQFAQACSALARNHGMTEFAIVVKDPVTGSPKVFATPGALADPVLRATAAEQFKLGAVQASTLGADDCEERYRKLQEKHTRLENEVASLGGDTGWTG